MGYDLHITRAADWTESDQDPITLDEWLACIRDDAELQREQAAGAEVDDGVTLALTLPGLARWTAWSRREDPTAKVYLWHAEHHVVARGIDAEVTAKLYRIAQRLGARVFGDEGEEYGPHGEVVATDEPAPPRRSWWRRLFGSA